MNKHPMKPYNARLSDLEARARALGLNETDQRSRLRIHPYTLRYLGWGLLTLQLIFLAVALLLLLPGNDDTAQPADELLIPADMQPVSLVPDQPMPPVTKPSTGALPASPAANHLLRIRGVEVTQGIQVFNEPEHARCQPYPNHPDHVFCNNSMPFVAGRHTLIRTYLACGETCPTHDVTVQLRLLKNGKPRAIYTETLTAAHLSQISHFGIGELRLDLNRSVNFELFPPPHWMVDDVTFDVQVITPGAARFPRTAVNSTFVERKPLRIAYLPITYQGLRPPEPEQVDYWLMRLFPVAEVEYYRLPIPDLIWEGELSKGAVLQKLLYTYWLYGHYRSVDTMPDQLFGWLPQEFYNGGASDPNWCHDCVGMGSSRVAFGGLRPEMDLGGPRILVHEVAHNLGARHAWSPTHTEDRHCFRAEGADIGVDPQWPYSQTPNIQEFGIDLYSDPPTVYPPSFYDVMAYCALPWISPHTYRTLFESPILDPNADTQLTVSAEQLEQGAPSFEATSTGGGQALLVTGRIHRDGSLVEPHIQEIDQSSAFMPPPPPTGDDYCVDIQDSQSFSLAQHCFDVGFTDLETGLPLDESPFLFTMPYVPGASQVVISRDNQPVSVIASSNNPPSVTVTFPNGGEILKGQQEITWAGTDLDGDSLRYDVLYSPDGGLRWLPLAIGLSETYYTIDTAQLLNTSDALVLVVANDGFLASEDASDAVFTVEPPAPNSLSLRGPARVTPEQTFEVDVVLNRVPSPGLERIEFQLEAEFALLDVQELRLNPNLVLVAAENVAGRAMFRLQRATDQPLMGNVTLGTLVITSRTDTAPTALNLADAALTLRDGTSLSAAEVYALSLQVE